MKLVVWWWLAWWGEKGGEGLIAISLGEGEGKTYCLLLVRGASSARAAGAAGASVTAHFDGWVWGGGSWVVVCLFGVVVEVGRALLGGKGTATKRGGGVIYRPSPQHPTMCFRVRLHSETNSHRPSPAWLLSVRRGWSIQRATRGTNGRAARAGGEGGIARISRAAAAQSGRGCSLDGGRAGRVICSGAMADGGVLVWERGRRRVGGGGSGSGRRSPSPGGGGSFSWQGGDKGAGDRSRVV